MWISREGWGWTFWIPTVKWWGFLWQFRVRIWISTNFEIMKHSPLWVMKFCSRYFRTWHNIIWYDIMIWFDMHMIWYDMIWYAHDMIWHDIMICSRQCWLISKRSLRRRWSQPRALAPIKCTSVNMYLQIHACMYSAALYFYLNIFVCNTIHVYVLFCIFPSFSLPMQKMSIASRLFSYWWLP